MRENLYYGAKLRVYNLSESECSNLCETTALSVGLQGTLDTIVGTDLIKGISGGQARRLSIAMALLAAPRIICLDGELSVSYYFKLISFACRADTRTR